MSQNKLVPHYTVLTAQYLVDADILPLYVDPDVNHTTTAYKFGQAFDLLSICTSKALVLSGIADQTDSIDTTVSVDSFYYRNKEGRIFSQNMRHIFAQDMRHTVFGSFIPALGDGGRTAEMKNKIYIATPKLAIELVARDGVLIGRNTRTGEAATQEQIASATAAMLADGEIIVELTGSINYQTGETKIMAVCNDDSIELIGYTLIAHRTNSNRRPRID